jgi:hypothetical protein
MGNTKVWIFRKEITVCIKLLVSVHLFVCFIFYHNDTDLRFNYVVIFLFVVVHYSRIDNFLYLKAINQDYNFLNGL